MAIFDWNSTRWLLPSPPLHRITPAILVIVPPAKAPPPTPPGDVKFWRALFVSSSFIFCSIRNWASVRLFGCPDILTIRFLVPGANMPLLEIWMFAPDRCWISVRLRPPGPVQHNHHHYHHHQSGYQPAEGGCGGCFRAQQIKSGKEKRKRQTGMSTKAYNNDFIKNYQQQPSGTLMWLN